MIWKVILKALLRNAFKITKLIASGQKRKVNAPGGSVNLLSCGTSSFGAPSEEVKPTIGGFKDFFCLENQPYAQGQNMSQSRRVTLLSRVALHMQL